MGLIASKGVLIQSERREMYTLPEEERDGVPQITDDNQ